MHATYFKMYQLCGRGVKGEEFLLHKHEAKSLVPQFPWKKSSVATGTYNPTTGRTRE